MLNLFNLVHGTLGDVLDVDITSLLAPPTKDTSSSSLVVDAKDSVVSLCHLKHTNPSPPLSQ